MYAPAPVRCLPPAAPLFPPPKNPYAHPAPHPAAAPLYHASRPATPANPQSTPLPGAPSISPGAASPLCYLTPSAYAHPAPRATTRPTSRHCPSSPCITIGCPSQSPVHTAPRRPQHFAKRRQPPLLPHPKYLCAPRPVRHHPPHIPPPLLFTSHQPPQPPSVPSIYIDPV